jgi:hypothetical protein
MPALVQMKFWQLVVWLQPLSNGSWETGSFGSLFWFGDLDMAQMPMVMFGSGFITEKKYSKGAKEFISNKMHKMKDEDRPQAQKVAIAMSYARKKGLKVPPKK